MSKSLKNISVVAAATMVSRVLGLGRDMLVTAVFGTSALASAFYTAFTLPNLFRRLLGEGALTAALVPTLSDELKTSERTGAFQLVNQVASWLLVVTGVVVILAMTVLWQVPQLAGLWRGWGMEADTFVRLSEAARLAIVLFPYLVLVCLAAAFSATLQTLHRFLEPALSPIWLNLAMIGLLGGAVYGGWATAADDRMRWLCAGALLGGFLQMVVPAAALMAEGWRPRFDLTASPAIKQIVKLMGPTVFGSAIYLINMAVARIVGLSLNDSAVTVLNLATRLMELPIGVFAVAVSTVIFPLISRYAAAGDQVNLASAYRKGMRLILVVNVPAAVGLMVLATPIIRLLFQRGAFQAEDTALMEPVLATYALGLPFLSFVNLILRAFYAQKDTVTPVRAAVLSFVVNLGLSLALMKPLGTVGLAVAGTVSTVVQAWYLQRKLSRGHEGLHFRHLARDLVKVLGASLAMGVVVAGGWAGWILLVPASKAADAIGLAILIGGGVAVYAGLLWMLRIEGRDELAEIFAKLRQKLT
ncbi:MAG: murein biosynthesis integral membrane protein MurJ [Opitutaceae bacterium]|nr:murein biosynthesis integral membrane protein MurJ [Opitutaceae bacterium]MBP9913639.1 murein biosynthesis integral membrane protein MurJ [Opitutaceae bacterium]